MMHQIEFSQEELVNITAAVLSLLDIRFQQLKGT